MNLIELYNKISDPIDNEDNIRKLLDLYKKSIKNKSKFWKEINTANSRDYLLINNLSFNQELTEKEDEFFKNIVEMWLEKASKLSQTEIESRVYELNGNKPDKEFSDDIFFYSRQTSEKVIKKLCSWAKKMATRDNWKYITNITKSGEPIHRLYLHTEDADTFKMIEYFVKKCIGRNLEYELKYDLSIKRDDSIVIYCYSDEQLKQYLEILKEIKNEHPQLVSRTKELPLLTGKIENWIGYGSKLQDERYPDESYTGIRALNIELVFDKMSLEWVKNNENKEVLYNDKKITLLEYIKLRYKEILLLELSKKEASKKKNIIYKIFDKRKYVKNIDDIINCYLEKILFCKKYNKIELNIAKNESMVLSGDILKSIIFETLEVTPEFIKNTQKEIKNNYENYGICKENTCFDRKVADRIKNERAQEVRKEEENITKQQKIEIGLLYDSSSKKMYIREDDLHLLPPTLKKEIIANGKIVDDKNSERMINKINFFEITSIEAQECEINYGYKFNFIDINENSKKNSQK